MNIIEAVNWRYSTKEFDPTKKISDEDFSKVKTLLRMSPSSTNIQPWHFVITNTEDGKKRITKGTQEFYQFNEQKIMDASHVVVFCARTDADKDYMLHLLEIEDKDGRYPNNEIKQMVFGARNIFANMHKYDYKDQQHWMEKQVYMNMGNFLLGVAALEIDALPMEGVDMKLIDQEFGLRENGYTAVGIISLGYRKETDFNTPDKTPKSRLPEEELFTILK